MQKPQKLQKLRKYLNIKLFLWLLRCVRPFWHGIAAIVLFCSAGSLLYVGKAVISKQIIDQAMNKGFYESASYLFLLGLFFISQILLGSVSSAIMLRVSEKMSNSIQKDLVGHMYKTEWIRLNKFHSGDMLTRLTSDIGYITNFWVSIFPNIVSLFVQLVFAFVTLFYFDKTLAVFAFLLGPVSAVWGFIVGRKLKKLQHEIQTAESKNRSFIQETIANILIIKTFEQEEESIDRVQLNQARKLKWVIKRSNTSVLSSLVIGGGYWLGYFSAFVWGVYRLSGGLTSFGTFTAFIQLVGQVQGPFEGLARTIPQIATSLASVERVIEFEEMELENKKQGLPAVGDQINKLVLKKVSFSYIQSKPVLSDLSCHFKKGELSAIVGVSGEGKTTVMRLLLALIKPTEGSVYVEFGDGSQKALSADTRGYFSYVPQGNTLFSGTILDNLKIGKQNAAPEEIEGALRLACAWEFIQSLPQKENTVIGESGLGLSEGQAQRIAIARALLKNYQVLLLDEATSALDTETEIKVLNNIKNKLDQKTCIAVTHRMSVEDVCDRVFRLSAHGLLEVKR